MKNSKDVIAELATTLRKERHEETVRDLMRRTISELSDLRSFWAEEMKRLWRDRLRSEEDEGVYQEAKEMLGLITHALQHYHTLKQDSPAQPEGNAVLSVRGVAMYLGVSESIVRGMIRQKRIPFVKIEGQYKFYLIKLEEWLEQNTVGVVTTDSSQDDVNKISKKIWGQTVEKK